MIPGLSSRWRVHALCTALSVCGACGVPEPDATIRIDEASDQLRVTTEHGELAFGTWIPAEITENEPMAAWTFELTAQASVILRTEATSEGEIDTVLSLYRRGKRGWGRAIARNDDSSDTVLSALSRRLGAGQYRVVVTGYDQSAVGGFILASECRGAGCPKPAPECLFGATFHALVQGEVRTVEIANEEEIADIAQLGDALARAQLVLAVQQSSHSDVTTAEEALSRVDQQTVRRFTLVEPASTRAYTAYEYGAGDNSYGAIFSAGTSELAASIHDGDILHCTALVPECLLPATFPELRESDAFETLAITALNAQSLPELPEMDRAQLLAALRVNYSEADAPTLEVAIALADRGEVTRLALRHRESRRELVIYEHGAGDTSVGAVFERADTTIRAVISDGSFEQCRLPAR
jgi:hypothetical protein